MKLAIILRELREKQGLNQRELAEALHLTKNSISHYENSVNAPSIETLILIADYFDISVDYLLGRSAEKISYAKTQRVLYKNMTINKFIDILINMDAKHKDDLIKALDYINFHNKVMSEK